MEYLLRFSHLVAGIAWIGSSFYFIWLDSSFEPPETPRRNVEGELFMVHGGFYYQVEKKKIYPGELPRVLHWFKWEATLTWVTGIVLLAVLYFLKGASLLIDPSVMALTQAQAVTLALGLIAGCWLVYDLLWNPRVPKPLSAAVSVVFFALLIWGLTRVFSGRGAFIMTGAIFGSLMLANVWMRILPGQAKMLREAQEGRVPDYSVGLKSKTRSVHNTYFTFPVLFIMLSNHYPQIYNHAWNWLLLIVLAVSGALTRHAMVTKRPLERWTLFPAAMGLAALVWASGHVGPASMGGGARPTWAEVAPVIERRCASCHSLRPTDDVWKVAPLGAIFDSENSLRAKAEKVMLQVVTARTMPLGNKTAMTDEERDLVRRFLE